MKKKSGIKGVVWCSRFNKWIAQLECGGVHYWGGYHKTINKAAAARKKLVEEHGPVLEPIVLKIKKHTTRSVCRVVKCISKTSARGLCGKHYGLCDYYGYLDDYGAPTYRGGNNTYEINREASPNECRIIMNGEPCDHKIYIRGLCKRHYNKYHRDGKLKKFALKPHAMPKRAIGVRDYDYSDN